MIKANDDWWKWNEKCCLTFSKNEICSIDDTMAPIPMVSPFWIWRKELEEEEDAVDAKMARTSDRESKVKLKQRTIIAIIDLCICSGNW